MQDDLNELPLSKLFHRLVDSPDLRWLIEAARHEDLNGVGDVTSDLFIPGEAQGSAELRTRQAGRLCGAALLPRIATAYDMHLHVLDVVPDGSAIEPGAVIGIAAGPLRSLLAAERVMLNFLTCLSGIATTTARYVEAVRGTKARIYDTRKTLPGLRHLSKYAVRCGGGYCHRIGLYDAVLVKDNHLGHVAPGEADAFLRGAIERARRMPVPVNFVEVEVDTLEMLEAVLGCDVDIVLLDNMNVEQLRAAVAMRDRLHPGVQLEASGGVNLQSVRAVAETGVDRIAVGALTHSAGSLDIGLDIA